jgi:hypothetical protein
MEGPFSSLESAHEYVTLLGQQVREVRASILEDITVADGRRLDALRIVDLKLTQLDQHLASSGRTLNDLRALRRLLLGEREEVAVAHTR